MMEHQLEISYISDLIRGYLGATDWLDSSEKNLIKINLGTVRSPVLDIAVTSRKC